MAMSDITDKLDKIAETITTLVVLFQEEIYLVKAEQRDLKKEIDRLSYYVARVEGTRRGNVKEL